MHLSVIDAVPGSGPGIMNHESHGHTHASVVVTFLNKAIATSATVLSACLFSDR